MFWRISSFLLCQLSAGLFGWWMGQDRGAAAGIVAGGVMWFLLDLARGTRVLRWLRRGEMGALPFDGGLWGEVADRARRAMRSREHDTQEAQQRLQEFLAAMQSSPNGVLLLDVQGRIEWSNQTAEAHFGIDAQRDVMQLVGNLVRDPAFTAYYTGGDYAREITIMGRGHSATRPVRIAVHLHAYGRGRKLMLSRDITAVEQAETMRRDFVANVSHEIRTPLTVLAGFVETLQNLPLAAEERARYLALMAQQASRMQTLVSDLLTLSRLEGSPLPSSGEWCTTGVLMAQCELEARALSTVLGKPHEFQFDSGPPAEIAGSSAELLSAMSNLVSNAIRYTPAGSSVSVGWQVLADGRGQFAVHDNGPGIAPEHIARLTERFYRVDRSRSRETGGTGLGLAIVKHVVQRHGGELRIDSALGAGSTFTVQFPANRIRLAAGRSVAPVSQPATA